MRCVHGICPIINEFECSRVICLWLINKTKLRRCKLKLDLSYRSQINERYNNINSQYPKTNSLLIQVIYNISSLPIVQFAHILNSEVYQGLKSWQGLIFEEGFLSLENNHSNMCLFLYTNVMHCDL